MAAQQRHAHPQCQGIRRQARFRFRRAGTRRDGRDVISESRFLSGFLRYPSEDGIDGRRRALTLREPVARLERERKPGSLRRRKWPRIFHSASKTRVNALMAPMLATKNLRARHHTLLWSYLTPHGPRIAARANHATAAL